MLLSPNNWKVEFLSDGKEFVTYIFTLSYMLSDVKSHAIFNSKKFQPSARTHTHTNIPTCTAECPEWARSQTIERFVPFWRCVHF